MSAASNPALAQQESFGKRLRHVAIGVLFALVLLVPKILHARRNARSWTLFRIFLGVAGAAMVILPLGAWSSYAPAVIGLVMFVSAILLPPAKPVTHVDDKVRELGALVVVNGGRFKLGDAASFAAQLFAGAEHVSVRDSRLQSFLEIPVSQITSAQPKASHGRWFLRLDCGHQTAAIAYEA